MFVWRDLMIFPRLAVYYIVLNAAKCVGDKDFSPKIFTVFFYAISVLAVLVTIIQYYNLFNLNYLFVRLYRPSDEWLVKMVAWRRAWGAMGNPNYWGLVLGQFALFMFILLIWYRKLIAAPIIVGLLYAIILTGSRSSLIAFSATILTGSPLLVLFHKQRPHFIVLIFSSLFIALALGYLFSSGSYEGVERYTTEKLGSALGRIQRWRQVLDRDLITLFLGSGPNKSARITWVDNSFIKILYEQGFLGFISYFLLLLSIFIKSLKHVGSQYSRFPAFSLFVLLAVIHWTIFEFAADSWSNVRCAPLMLAYFGFSAALQRQSA